MNRRIIMMDYAGGHSFAAGLRGEVYGPKQIAALMQLVRLALWLCRNQTRLKRMTRHCGR